MQLIHQKNFHAELPPEILNINNDVCCVQDYIALVKYYLPEREIASDFSDRVSCGGYDQIGIDNAGCHYFGIS